MTCQGTVVRAYGGFYYVLTESGSLTCKPRGRLRLTENEILVGDRVQVTEVGRQSGVIESVCERQTVLSRPRIANVQLAAVVIAARNPDPSPFLIDRYLALIAHSELGAVLCINKIDLATAAEVDSLRDIYSKAGYDVILTSAVTNVGIDELERRLSNTVSVLAGPSGVGKSAILRAMCPTANVVSGDVSKRTGRGKHTTRHAQLVTICGGGLVADSPGFSYLRLDGIDAEELRLLYPEFREHMQRCKFSSCFHRGEPQCGVLEAVEAGIVSRTRYDNYLKLLTEIELDQR
jgi:ribosome biogenesis GTPase